MEYTIETIEMLANENVTAIETGLVYSNRIRISLENGYTIVADIVSIQDAEERLAEIENELEKAKQKVADYEAAKLAISEIAERIRATETL
jgi:F0F1-type ATP synthase epsilon subunit